LTKAIHSYPQPDAVGVQAGVKVNLGALDPADALEAI
jgi:hypothetical protein